VTGSGSGTPDNFVAFPGAYTGNEPGILIGAPLRLPRLLVKAELSLLDIYNLPANYPGYQSPGPAVWPGSGGSVSRLSLILLGTETRTYAWILATVATPYLHST
jgi:hypothetical protein